MHGCPLQLFKRMLDQFDRLRKRNAFLEQYKKERMFENGLEEFDDARCVLCFRFVNDPSVLVAHLLWSVWRAPVQRRKSS